MTDSKCEGCARLDWLEKHFTALLNEQDRRVETIKKDSDKALAAALDANNIRMHNLNEWRSMTEGWASKFAQSETVSIFKEAQEKINLRHEQAINRGYGAMAIVGLLGVINAVRLFVGA